MRAGSANIKERLDRGLGSQSFIVTFPNLLVIHLPRMRSDHHLLLVRDVNFSSRNKSYRLFRILAAWFVYSGFKRVIKENWITGRLIQENMASCRWAIGHWNHFSFGNIF